MELKNKIIVITGGTKGFGRTLTEAFLWEGSKVVICSTNQVDVEAVAKELGVFGVCADVTKEEDMTRLADETVKQFGGIDIWINNAGLWIPHALVEDFDMSKVRKMFDVNITGLINGSRVALRLMKEKGSGTIVNVISDSALAERPMSSTYSASKWAVHGFTKSIRAENKNISILSIFPGAMKTDIFGAEKPDTFNDFMDTKYVAEKVITNLKLQNPVEELVIQKPVI